MNLAKITSNRRGMIKFFLIFFLVFALGIAIGYFSYLQKAKLPFFKKTSGNDVYSAFLFEVYDKIEENYWQKISPEELAKLFQLGAEKITGSPLITEAKNKEELGKLLTEVMKGKTKEEKKDFALKLSDVVLANLKPFGRSRLYSIKEEEDLKNRVANIDPNVDQYQVLGVGKDSSDAEIKKTYEEKTKELEPYAEASPEAKQKLAQVEKAYEVLKEKETREVYDASGVEPTVIGQLVTPQILHLRLKKFSPTTFDELRKVTEKFDKGEELDTLIFDLRDNVGGAIDGLPYFLGPFIGIDQYAYQFFHQEGKEDFKTKTGWLQSLVRYKKVVVLVNEGTQSSAEVMAATLKKYNVGILVGTTTKGWGTVEKVFSLDTQIDDKEKYSIFLVHSLTLREDGQPIEGNGVEPTININDPDWQKKLYAYFNYPELVETLKEIFTQS